MCKQTIILLLTASAVVFSDTGLFTLNEINTGVIKGSDSVYMNGPPYNSDLSVINPAYLVENSDDNIHASYIDTRETGTDNKSKVIGNEVLVNRITTIYITGVRG